MICQVSYKAIKSFRETKKKEREIPEATEAFCEWVLDRLLLNLYFLLGKGLGYVWALLWRGPGRRPQETMQRGKLEHITHLTTKNQSMHVIQLAMKFWR